MQRKILDVLICMLLITTFMQVTGAIKEKKQYDTSLFETQNIISTNLYRSETSNNIDQLDQYYTNNAYALNIDDTPNAQTFKPSYSTITRLEILLDKEGSPTNYRVYGLTLMSGVPGGTVNQIWGTVIQSSSLATGVYWHEVDILDQCVLPGATYHIQIRGIEPQESTDNLGWCYGWEEPYTKGDAYYYINSEWKLFEVGGTPCDFCFKTYGTDFGGNHAPNRPSKPTGPSTGTIETTYPYATTSTDPDGDKINYGWDWDGDGTVDDWTEAFDSGAACLISHNWSNEGTYQVKVRSLDSHGREGDWSEPLSVTIPKSKTIDQSLFSFLKNHPHLFPLIRHVLF